MSELVIPAEAQIAWFTRYERFIPDRIRPLARQRFVDNVATYGDKIFQKLMTPEGEAALLQDMDEEEADWWVYWIVSRAGYELAEKYFVAEHTPSSVIRMREKTPPDVW